MRQLYRGGNLACKCISTTPIGAPIYIWPRAAIPPAPPLVMNKLVHECKSSVCVNEAVEDKLDRLVTVKAI